MKSTRRIMYLLLIMLIMMPHTSEADERIGIYGVKISLKNGNVLNGYILSYSLVSSCNKSKENINKWDSYLENNLDGGTVIFIGKLVKIVQDDVPWFLAAKSSLKSIKIDNIKSIEGVCRKWSDTDVSAFSPAPIITDYMAEYATNHKMIAAYTFDHESVPHDDDDYAFGQCTTYFSYNPKYPRERLMKQRKIIDKMSDDILDKNKLIRFRSAYD